MSRELPLTDLVELLPTRLGAPTKSPSAWRVNLYRLPWIRLLLESRWPQLVTRMITLAGFVFIIISGLAGSRVGSHNFAIIMVWIAWWTALKLGFIPFGGRSWCSVCPIPLPGDWLQQGGILGRGAHPRGLNLRWPKKLRRTWLQSAGFLLIGLFSAVTLTDPRVTGWVLLGLFVLSTALSLVFEKRAFCTTLCPIGGFCGMYARTAPLEIRAIDRQVCARHEVKSCYQACPWGLYPVSFRDSSACGLCMECLRACPSDNLALNLRTYGSDITPGKHTFHLDETFLALVMLGSVITFAAVFTGPWGWLKLAAFHVGSTAWLAYALAFLAINLALIPGLYTLAVSLSRKLDHSAISLKHSLITHAQALLPLGLLAWIAFTVSFAFPKLNYVLGVLNDPLGWGWHLLGQVNYSQTLDVSSFSPNLQVLLLLAGLVWSARVTLKLGDSPKPHTWLINLPVLAFSLAFTLLMTWLLVG